jgi:hypothetical protein
VLTLEFIADFLIYSRQYPRLPTRVSYDSTLRALRMAKAIS